MRIEAVLAGIKRLCIETSPFIYFVETNPSYIHRMRAIFQPVDAGLIECVTSVITLTETLNKPIQLGDKALQQTYYELLTATANISVFPVNTEVAVRAAQLRAQYNLKTPDALQLATAMEARCDAFLTNDIRLNRIKEVPVLVLDELEI